MSVGEILKQRLDEYKKGKLAVVGTVRQVTSLLKLLITVPYPTLGASDEKEIGEEHSN